MLRSCDTLALQQEPGSHCSARQRTMATSEDTTGVAPRLGVRVSGYFLQRMKTRWGSCNPAAGNIRLNTELAKKPKDLVEDVAVHEVLHLLETTHNEQFVALLARHWPQWQESRRKLNALPLAPEHWTE
jgi:hypothetical protein